MTFEEATKRWMEFFEISHHYCMFCHEHRVMERVDSVVLKNERTMLKGICVVCGHVMVKII